MSILVVTGTGTGVGKTVVTAGIAALALRNGQTVAVVKPGQTGIGDGMPGDLDDIRRLAGVETVQEHGRFPDPLAPAAAARLARKSFVNLRESAQRIAALDETFDLVLVEGAGGLLVHFDDARTSIAHLAQSLAAPIVLVVHASLGTLNHTELTLEAMARRALDCRGVVIGSWPTAPGLAERCNLRDLEDIVGEPLTGAIAEQSGELPSDRFLKSADRGLAPNLGGSFNAASFRITYDPTPSEAAR
ncbi:MAG TPA: dethiobiotin synthase [Actinomycetes bacterium]|nr:dethiobiotin synthase [Actinomycetes bacterium]